MLALLVGCLLGPAVVSNAMAQTWPTYSQEIPYSGLRSAPTTSFPDQAPFGGVRFDKLEWNGLGGNDRARWDMEAFVGNDYDKLFFKSEGTFDGRTRKFDEARIQALYSRMISYFFDFQVGVRHDLSPKPSRTYAVIGIEGLAPGFFEIDADAYISQKGEPLRVSHGVVRSSDHQPPRSAAACRFEVAAAIRPGAGTGEWPYGLRAGRSASL
ncbi:copper resistance protein B [Bradyrhizobium guangxiense]